MELNVCFFFQVDQQWNGNFQFVFAAQQRKPFFHTVLYIVNTYFFFFFFLSGSWSWVWRQCNLTWQSTQLSILIWKIVGSGTKEANGGLRRSNFSFTFWLVFMHNFSEVSVFLLPNCKMEMIIFLYIFSALCKIMKHYHAKE